MSRYEREVPDEIVDVVEKVDDIFDELYVLFTDYTGKVERQIEAEKRQKDPILFGVFKDDKNRVCNDRFYYLGDWIDGYCDLTLEKMINESSINGKEIKRTIKSLNTMDDIKDYLSSYQRDENSFSMYTQPVDISESSNTKDRSFFSRVTTFLKGKKR